VDILSVVFTSVSDILQSSCDEAGHTGPDLLQKDQRMFAFSSVAIGDDEAFEVVREAREAHPVQMPELKASKLLGTDRGRKLIAALIAAIGDRYVVSVNDKLLALCGWFFEYIYEPVYQDNPRLLYEKNFHLFVAMYTYLWMTDPTSDAKQAIEQFQKYMRSRDPADAPFLFNNPRPPFSDTGTEHPFESVLRGDSPSKNLSGGVPRLSKPRGGSRHLLLLRRVSARPRASPPLLSAASGRSASSAMAPISCGRTAASEARRKTAMAYSSQKSPFWSQTTSVAPTAMTESATCSSIPSC
jgi:hypothetical protein